MNCPKCKSILPDDSEFCQFCGTKIESKSFINVSTRPTVSLEDKEITKQENVSTPVFIASSKLNQANQTVQKPNQEATKEQHCKVCGGLIDSKTKKCISCGKQYLKLRPLVLAVILLAVILSVSAALNVYQYYDAQQKSSQIFSLKSQVNENKDKAESYDDLISALSTGNLGYAANNFQSSESVIVVSKNQKDRKFTLTAYWPSEGTVTTSYSPSLLSSALVAFDNDEWNSSTTMTITPSRTGITTVTFSNNIDSKEFKVIIIVTD